MAMKSSKIAVTLQPSLKQKLREYGKENQIKNFSGVILAILDEYFGGASSASEPAPVASSDVWDAIQTLTARLDALESSAATTVKTTDKPKVTTKPKATATGKTGTRTKATAAKTTTTKRSTTKSTTGKAASSTKAATAKKAKPTKATKTTAAKTKSTRSVKSSSKAAPVKKAKPTKGRATKGRKSPKSKPTVEWMSTREAFNIYGGNLSWSRFSKLTPEELKDRFNLDSDLSRKVRGSRFNQWLKPGK